MCVRMCVWIFPYHVCIDLLLLSTVCVSIISNPTLTLSLSLSLYAHSDMKIRVHDTIACRDKEYTGHTAPVLSVALDPKGEEEEEEEEEEGLEGGGRLY